MILNKRLFQIIIGSVLFIPALFINKEFVWLRIIIFSLSYIVAGGDILLKAFRNIFRGKVFDDNFLMSIATVGAFGIGEYPEGVAVMLFYKVGEMFQNYAVNKSRKSIASLMDIRPDYANLKTGNEIIKVEPDAVKIGDTIIIKPGEKVPLDCRIIEGNSTLNMSALTGESIPKEVEPGSNILSGCINISGMITAEVTKEFGESTVNKILDLVENASSLKSESENFITKFARYYTPIVVGIAAILVVIPPLFTGGNFIDWLLRAFIFLVVSCPCALVISIPLSFFGGIGGASKNGILIKGSNSLEALANTEVIAFDKTGTLTKGVFKVQEIHEKNMDKKEILKFAAYAENYSGHPIAASLKEAYGQEISSEVISDVEEISGHGICANIENRKVFVGNSQLMKKMGIVYDESEAAGTIVHVAADNEYRGYIVISDEIKEDTLTAIKELKKVGIKHIVMLTGDSKKVGEKVGEELNINEVYAELLPADKIEKLEELFKNKSQEGKLVFVGDGINDAPVLTRADIGIAMGGLGTDAAIEAADIVIMTDEPSKISTAIKISKKTLRIVKENIILALSIKLIVLILGAFGIATMWEAVFADVGVSIIAILNTFRVKTL
jgi:Cd2+/Zn2+-exporting ATPase